MTTVEFPFGVKKSKDEDGHVSYSFIDTRFRFTIRTARELELASVVGIGQLLAQGQSVRSVVLLVCYGLKFERKRITEDDAINLLDEFVEAGGDVKALTEALTKALAESGVYGSDLMKQRAAIDLSLPPDAEREGPLVTAT